MDFFGGEDEQLSTLWSFFQEYFAYILEHTQLNISKFAIIATSLHYHILKDVMIIKTTEKYIVHLRNKQRIAKLFMLRFSCKMAKEVFNNCRLVKLLFWYHVIV